MKVRWELTNLSIWAWCTGTRCIVVTAGTNNDAVYRFSWPHLLVVLRLFGREGLGGRLRSNGLQQLCRRALVGSGKRLSVCLSVPLLHYHPADTVLGNVFVTVARNSFECITGVLIRSRPLGRSTRLACPPVCCLFRTWAPNWKTRKVEKLNWF